MEQEPLRVQHPRWTQIEKRFLLPFHPCENRLYLQTVERDRTALQGVKTFKRLTNLVVQNLDQPEISSKIKESFEFQDTLRSINTVVQPVILIYLLNALVDQ